MKKIFKNISNTLFDMASLPIILIFFGIPLLLIIIVCILVIISIKLIVKAIKKNKSRQDNHIHSEDDNNIK